VLAEIAGLLVVAICTVDAHVFMFECMIFLQMIEVLKTMSKNPVVSEGKILRRTRTATW
jgi:hypothetical protein